MTQVISRFAFFIAVGLCWICAGCGGPVDEKPPQRAQQVLSASETFGYDLDLLQQYQKVVVLKRDSMQVLIVPGYQARVMTSSATGLSGRSYGWINHELVQSGKYEPHINAYGGEERFWLGPEGGQFGLFFEKGKPFSFANWQTPGLLDTAAFNTEYVQPGAAGFSKTATLRNYSGTSFTVTIKREIKLLENDAVESILGMPLSDLHWVGYRSVNSITNRGDRDWRLEDGVLSIWLLCMMKSSPANNIIVPYAPGGGDLVNDSYFGRIDEERLIKKDSFLLLKADAASRGKIGIPPAIVRPYAGSYDAASGVLTVIGFDYKGDTNYVNSQWEIQQQPYQGDVVNAYNDGPNESGSQLGKFYELETSSPAVALRSGQRLTHEQVVLHIEGKPEQLSQISLKLLGADLRDL